MANNLERVGPFVLESDDDGHHYVIPVSKQDDWNNWVGSHAAQNSASQTGTALPRPVGKRRRLAACASPASMR
jgi:hypothetical protein